MSASESGADHARQGIEAADVEELRLALEADLEEGKRDGLGPHTQQWLGKITEKLLKAGTHLGEATSAALLAEAILRFLGLS